MNTVRSSEEWIALISACRASGLTDREWCLENGIAPSSFYHNVKKLREQACSIPDRAIKSEIRKQSVVPLRILDEPILDSDVSLANGHEDASTDIQIEYRGFSIRIPAKAPENCISSVISALGNLC